MLYFLHYIKAAPADIAMGADGSVWLVSYTESFNATGRDVLLVRHSAAGGLLHALKWGADKADHGLALAVDSNESVWVSGYTDSFGAGLEDILVLKFASNGELLKALTWGGEQIEKGYGLAIDSQDHVWVSGNTQSFGSGSYDALFLKFSLDAELLLSVAWGVPLMVKQLEP